MATPSKEHPASALLSRAHSDEATASIFREKIQTRPLLLRPSSPDPKLDARAQRRRVRQQKVQSQRRSKKPKPLSAAQKRALGIYDIPKDQQKYTIYVPLHEMWCAYMREVLGIQKGCGYVTPMGAGPLVASADFHGAKVMVVRSRCVGRVGIMGIVLKDTKFTFEIITEKNELKTVPKEHTIFKIEVPFAAEAATPGEVTQKALVFELHGSQLENRAPDRATRKFRAHFDPDL